mmetsp:Transcript_41012/g.80918  ORF Transcript_41012/g.80918 Transcript_41012/m.80918 type:complete len:242 (+) Transcript_41012:186-911(+)
MGSFEGCLFSFFARSFRRACCWRVSVLFLLLSLLSTAVSSSPAFLHNIPHRGTNAIASQPRHRSATQRRAGGPMSLSRTPLYGSTAVGPAGEEREEIATGTATGAAERAEERSSSSSPSNAEDREEAVRQLGFALKGAGQVFFYQAVVTFLRASYLFYSTQKFPLQEFLHMINPSILCSLSLAAHRTIEETLEKKTSGTPVIKILTKIFRRAQRAVAIPATIALIKLCVEISTALKAAQSV